MPLSADTSANLLRSLKIVQSLGEAVPHGGVLKAIAGIGITILETAERLRLNKEECANIARRAAEHISVLRRLDEDEELSQDLRERLERYHRILRDVLRTVERLGSRSKSTSMFRATSVHEETKDCLDKLNEAYQMYIFESSIAANHRLTTLVNGMQSLSLRMDLQSSSRQGETDQIPLRQVEFGEEIAQVDKRDYVLRVEHGQMLDFTGRSKAVILRRFEVKPEVEDEDRILDEFKKEVELRGDLLNRYLARMLGIATSSTGRTKIIVVETGTTSGYDYLQSLSGIEYFTEYFRIMCEFVAAYRFLRGHRGSWKGGYRDVLLSAKDKRLCMGGLGRMDGRWEDSGSRMDEAYARLREGHDAIVGGSKSIEFYADRFVRMRESVIKWRNEETEENGRELWYWLRWWIRSSEIERRTENSPSVGEIGWREGNIWHPIPLVPQFPLAHPPQYEFSASRLRDGEWETIVGTQIEGFTRWSMDIVLGENIHLHTYVRSNRTNEIAELFVASALSLPKDLGVDVRSLRQVSRTGFDVYASLTILEDRASTVHYFAYPLRPNGSVLDPPGFWSLCPYPSRSERHLQADDAELCFHVGSILHYQSINDRILSVLQNLESHSFLPVPHITYASDPPFASITEVSHQRSPSPTIAMHPKKRFCDALLSAFSKKRKISHS